MFLRSNRWFKSGRRKNIGLVGLVKESGITALHCSPRGALQKSIKTDECDTVFSK